MRSTTGRPRQTTDEQVRIILDWYAEYLAWIDKRPAIPSLRALASHLGMSRGAVWDVIRRRGMFKQASPEDRDAALRERRRVMRALRADGAMKRRR